MTTLQLIRHLRVQAAKPARADLEAIRQESASGWEASKPQPVENLRYSGMQICAAVEATQIPLQAASVGAQPQ